jgi:hypothetical protein
LERLICPNTSEQCAYSGYCQTQKGIADAGGPRPGSALGNIHEAMADEAVEVMTSFCAEERVVALNSLAIRCSDDLVSMSASKRSSQIILSMSFFSN